MKLATKLSVMSIVLVVVTALLVTLGAVYKSDHVCVNLYTTSVEEEYNLINGFLSSKYDGSWNEQSKQLYYGELKAEELSTFVNQIYKQNNIYMSFCYGSERVATSVSDANGKSLKGTNVKDSVVSQVMTGKVVNGIETVNNVRCAVAYHPITDQNGKVIGIFYVGVDATKIAKSRDIMLLNSLMSVLLLSIVAAVVIHFLVRHYLRPLKDIQVQMERLSKKNFTPYQKVEQIHTKDEIGRIAVSCKDMVRTVRSMIGIIADSSDSIASISDNTRIHMNDLDNDVKDTVATTQEISAGMEENTASVQQVNASVESVKELLESFNERVQHGSDRADEIKQRAEKLNEKVVVKQKNAENMLYENQHRVKDAIEKSEKINQIEILADSISQIAAQTKLLALNATIEASRAGEAGLGFNVVAQEIQKLSVESSKSVTQIQEIVNVVVDSVRDLIKVTNEIMEFMNQDVMEAYGDLVSTGHVYNDDSEFMNSFTSDLSQKSDDLLMDMKNIAEAIEAISMTISENSVANNKVAENATDIADKTKDVLHMTDQLKENSDTFHMYVGEFQY